MPKIVAGVIAHDGNAYSIQAQNVWRRFMDKHPDIDVWFLKYAASVGAETVLDKNAKTIWVGYPEGAPREDEVHYMLKKTIVFFETMLLQDPSWEWMLRTDLSSLYHWGRLIETLQRLAPQHVLTSAILPGGSPTGCGTMFSRHIVQAIVDACHRRPDYLSKKIYDDVALGEIIRNAGFAQETWTEAQFFHIALNTPIQHTHHHLRCLLSRDVGCRSRDEIPMMNRWVTAWYPDEEAPLPRDAAAAVEFIEAGYQRAAHTVGDINEHIPTLQALVADGSCSAVAELGVRQPTSTYAFLKGLLESSRTPQRRRRLICVDKAPAEGIDHIREVAVRAGIELSFHQHDSATIVLPEPVDLLFIDTWHIYGHLKRELAQHHARVSRYIAMHDTVVDGEHGESVRCGWDTAKQAQESGYPESEIRTGLRPAIAEFLKDHPEWVLHADHKNNNGLVVLRRQP